VSGADATAPDPEAKNPTATAAIPAATAAPTIRPTTKPMLTPLVQTAAPLEFFPIAALTGGLVVVGFVKVVVVAAQLCSHLSTCCILHTLLHVVLGELSHFAVHFSVKTVPHFLTQIGLSSWIHLLKHSPELLLQCE